MLNRSGSFYRNVRILGFALLAGVFTASSAQAASIAFFRDAAFVEVGSVTDADDNMRAALVALGHTVNDFTGTSEASWVGGLNGNNLIVVPELFADVSASLSAGATSALQAAIAQGAGLITGPGFSSGSPNAGNLLNLAFGTSLTESAGGDTSTLNAFNALGTAFSGGPVTLPNINDSDSLDTSSFTAATVSIYDSATVGFSPVALITPGSGGQGVYLGWGWRSPTATDPDWNAVLGNAVTEVASETAISLTVTSVAEPSMIAVLGIGLAGLALARRRQTA